MAADNLPLRDEKFGHGKLPETFAKVRILPKTYVNQNKKQKTKNQNSKHVIEDAYVLYLCVGDVHKWIVLVSFSSTLTQNI